MRTLLFAGEGGWADHRTPQLLHSAGWQVVVADRLAQARASLAAGGYDRLVLAVPPEGPGADAATQFCLHLAGGDVPLAAILVAREQEAGAVFLDTELAVGLYCRNWPKAAFQRALLRFLSGPRLRALCAGPAQRMQFAIEREAPGRLCLVAVQDCALLDPACLALVQSPLAELRRCAAEALKGAMAGAGRVRTSARETARRDALPELQPG